MQVPLPLNLEILKWANETHEILSRAKLPEAVKFYNIYGIHNDTPHTIWYALSYPVNIPWFFACCLDFLFQVVGFVFWIYSLTFATLIDWFLDFANYNFYLSQSNLGIEICTI